MWVTHTLAISNHKEERAALKAYGKPVYVKMDLPWVKRADFQGVWVKRLRAVGSFLESILKTVHPWRRVSMHTSKRLGVHT